MTISSRFAVAIHILSLLELNKDGVSTSEYISGSVNTNPVVIRRIMSMLSKAGLANVRPGVAGAKLARDISEITLLDVYRAVHVVEEDGLFSVHEKPNPECPVGRNIQTSIEPIFSAAQKAMEDTLAKVTLQDIVEDIGGKETNVCD
ncbi:Rrf2 family transcriptional regulator [Paenibacillus motobuensis]|uniref:Rrf2 family transcriptional regulator n=1 Tax=Paenibacillus lutimineralis TaxID=2707005 RepID=A0A3S9UXN9_9BACL|nr:MULTISPECIES: Rrf2 family transcriptional regulator [Paenibacillus]AZS15078.1 Rrf2 family transcriptional regulator [Paenibacillus lutimineralis]MCM3039311.1 Rrf2 family transcriptional regulator [Paenibacillus lutimineralis]MCM3646415.1 Rrf2 family transcriptional regulator [Paenibacillus motobuensis]